MYAQHTPGFGDVTNTQMASTASTVATMLVSLTPIPFAGPIMAAIGAIGILITQAFSGCGETCVQASRIADQVEALLKRNLSTYMSAPVRYASIQSAALQVFDQAWAQLEQACGNPALAEAGMRCISERQRGGVAPWCPNPGHVGCDWFALYRDPIANDPNVVPDPGILSSIESAAGVSAPADWSKLLLPAAILAGIFLVAE